MVNNESSVCRLAEQGMARGDCLIETDGARLPACQATLKFEDGTWQRLIVSVHLSRPENYLSIYQSGCNLSCRKCHSWNFSRIKNGEWCTPADILALALEYQKNVTLREPRERATAWHAHDSCRCCGSCVLNEERSDRCPGVLPPEAIRYSPQGLGPARNIVAFTGGDLTCRPGFYEECARLIKAQTDLWLLLETNGFGLTPDNLDRLAEAGVDAFWLDIKAHDREKHQWLTGGTNEHILKLPREMIQRGFVLEVLSLYIPGLVETDELVKIARDLAAVHPGLPFTILAFFPEYRMKDFRSPTVEEMIRAYEQTKAAGLTQIRLGNVGIFARTEKDRDFMAGHVDDDAY